MQWSMGQTMILVCAIVGLALATPALVLFVARIHVTTLTMSATGEDRFRWPRESFNEWFGQGWQLFLAGAFALTFASVVGAPLGVVLGATTGFVVSGALCYVLFPMLLASVLTAPTPFLVLYPPTVGRLWRFPHVTLGVGYLLPLAPAAATLLGVGMVFAGHRLGPLTLTLALPLATSLHARAWGRLLWLAREYDRPKVRRRPKKRRDDDEPAELPDDIEILPDAEAFGDDDAAYAVRAGSADTEKVSLVAYYEKRRQRDREERVRAGHPEPDPIDRPDPPTPAIAATRVLPFLFYGDTVWHSAQLGLLTLVWSGLVRIVLGV